MASIVLNFSEIPWDDLEVKSRADLQRSRATVAAWRIDPSKSSIAREISVIDALLHLRADNRETADSPYFLTHALQHLTVENLKALINSPKVPHSSLARARAVDIAWCQGRACAHDAVESSIRAFISLAHIVLDPEHWLEAFDFINRAVHLGASLGRGRPQHLRALSEAFQMISTLADDPKYFSAKVANLLLNQRYSDPRSVGDIAQRRAERARSAGDLHRALVFLDVVLQARSRERNEEALRATRIEIATLIEAHASAVAEKQDFSAAAALQKNAIDAWRVVGGVKDDLHRARVELQRLQRMSVEQLARKSKTQGMDVSSMVAQARAHVSGKPLLNALLAFSLLRPPNSSLDPHRESAKKSVGEFLYHSLVPIIQVSNTGRTVHARDAGLSDPAAALDAALRLDLSILQQTLALGAIVPAAESIQLEHGLTTASVFAMVSRSPFVPVDRVMTFARGIALGFQGEFEIAALVLMPQFENAIRTHLELRGAVVSTLPVVGGQNELDLVALLALPEASEFLGTEELFELRSLLVDKAGTNLRNEISHGLVTDGGRYAHMVYFWWKVVQYVFLPFLPGPPQADDTGGSEKAG